jgi:hypothetical protein
MVAALKKGKKIESFLIKKPAYLVDALGSELR